MLADGRMTHAEFLRDQHAAYPVRSGFFAPGLLSTDRNDSEGIRRSVYSLYRAKEIALAEIDAVLAEQGVRHRHVKEEIG